MCFYRMKDLQIVSWKRRFALHWILIHRIYVETALIMSAITGLMLIFVSLDIPPDLKG